jgi:TolB protein
MLFFFTGGEQKLWGGIIARDIETGEEREIARVPFMWPENGWTELAISPDGRYLTFRSPVDESWTAVRLVPTTGGEVRELYRFQVQSEPALFGQLSWTPDGRNVLFVRSTGKDGMPELWRMPIAGGEPQRTGLSMKGMRVVAVHPDGRRIAFDSSQGSGAPGELWVLENIPGAAESKPVAAAK